MQQCGYMTFSWTLKSSTGCHTELPLPSVVQQRASVQYLDSYNDFGSGCVCHLQSFLVIHIFGLHNMIWFRYLKYFSLLPWFLFWFLCPRSIFKSTLLWYVAGTKKAGGDEKGAPQSVFQPSTCDFGPTRKNPLCLLFLPFFHNCGRLVTLHGGDISGLEMGSISEEADK